MKPTPKRKKNRTAQRLGRLGGQANTPAQQAARRRNAQRAGRPRRVCETCGEPVVGGHADRRLDRQCGQHGWRWERGGTRLPTPANPDRTALDAIARHLSTPALTDIVGAIDTLTAIADLVRLTGRTVPAVSA
jgi:hypothetical protein